MNKLLSFVTLMSLVQPSLAEDCQRLPDKVTKSIASYVHQLRGAEYCRFRVVARGDIDSDGIEDLIVAFTVEGACNEDKETSPGACGNHAEQYLKAFLGKELKEIPILEIGSDWGRFVRKLTVKNGTIEAETKAHGPNDSHASLSVTGETEFSLRNGVLTENHP